MAQLKILVVDDDPEVCEFLGTFFASLKAETTLLSDPSQALEKLKTDQHHIAVVDLMMPQLGGVDLIAQIRAVDNDIAIVILTGHPSLETATSVMEYDVSAYIRKPCDTAELRQVVQRVAKKKGLHLTPEQELHATIGQTIRDLRKDRGLTLKQMARRTNLSVSLLSQIERAESSASVSSLFKVATALDVSIRTLFGTF